MENKKFTEYNPQVLKDSSNFFELDQNKELPVKVEIKFNNFYSMGGTVSAILDAIVTLGFCGAEPDLATCASLAQLANQIMPQDQLDFLDRLLIKTNFTEEHFIKTKE